MGVAFICWSSIFIVSSFSVNNFLNSSVTISLSLSRQVFSSDNVPSSVNRNSDNSLWRNILENWKELDIKYNILKITIQGQGRPETGTIRDKDTRYLKVFFTCVILHKKSVKIVRITTFCQNFLAIRQIKRKEHVWILFFSRQILIFIQ